jgi:hypothetical protein
MSGRLITTVLRTGKTPAAAEILNLLKRVVFAIRARWPRLRICLRAGGHHSKPEVLEWCDAVKVDYIIGCAPNARLEREFAQTIMCARKRYAQHKEQGFEEKEVRTYGSGWHVGGAWEGTERRVVARVICGPNGLDARFIVTSFESACAKALYEEVYCGRGNTELYIRAHKLELGGDRLSCRRACANQMRLFLHSAAYIIMEQIRRRLLGGTKFARTTFGRIRHGAHESGGATRRAQGPCARASELEVARAGGVRGRARCAGCEAGTQCRRSCKRIGIVSRGPPRAENREGRAEPCLRMEKTAREAPHGEPHALSRRACPGTSRLFRV